MIFLKKAEDLTLELWNKRAEQLSGVRAEDILGKTGFESFPAEEMRVFHERDRSVLDGKRLVATEEALNGSRGRDLAGSTPQKIPILDATGEPRYPRHLGGRQPSGGSRPRSPPRAKDAAELANRAKTDFPPTSATSSARRSRSSWVRSRTSSPTRRSRSRHGCTRA